MAFEKLEPLVMGILPGTIGISFQQKKDSGYRSIRINANFVRNFNLEPSKYDVEVDVNLKMLRVTENKKNGLFQGKKNARNEIILTFAGRSVFQKLAFNSQTVKPNITNFEPLIFEVEIPFD